MAGIVGYSALVLQVASVSWGYGCGYEVRPAHTADCYV